MSDLRRSVREAYEEGAESWARGPDVVYRRLAEALVRHHRTKRPPGTVGDALRLPFRGGAFDAVVAAFSLNHLPDPGAGLRECGRVVRAGGAVLASTFPVDADHPAKEAVESALLRFGYRRPPWYDEFKRDMAHLTGDPSRFESAASEAGLVDVTVAERDVDAGLGDPHLVVEWRLNMPHAIGFVNGWSRPPARRYEPTR